MKRKRSIPKAQNNGNTKNWHPIKDREYKTIQGYPIQGVEFVDTDALEVDKYGNVLNPYTGGYGSVLLPEVQVVGFRNAHYTNPNDRRMAEIIRDRNRRKEVYRQIYGTDEGFYMSPFAINDMPLKTVYPEFDLITLGQGLKSLFKPFGKNLYKLSKSIKSYTGKNPLEWRLFEEDPYRFKIWTTDDPKMAEAYTLRGYTNELFGDEYGNGRVFTVYEHPNNKFKFTFPKAPEGYGFDKMLYPYKLGLNGELLPKELPLILVENTINPERGATLVTNRKGVAKAANGFGETIDNFLTFPFMQHVGKYNTIEIPDIIDYYYKDALGKLISPAMTERIYFPSNPMCRPITVGNPGENIFLTAWRTRKLNAPLNGITYSNPIPGLTLGTGNILYDYTK